MSPIEQSLLYTGKTPLELAAERGDKQALAALWYRAQSCEKPTLSQLFRPTQSTNKGRISK